MLVLLGLLSFGSIMSKKVTFNEAVSLSVDESWVQSCQMSCQETSHSKGICHSPASDCGPALKLQESHKDDNDVKDNKDYNDNDNGTVIIMSTYRSIIKQIAANQKRTESMFWLKPCTSVVYCLYHEFTVFQTFKIIFFHFIPNIVDYFILFLSRSFYRRNKYQTIVIDWWPGWDMVWVGCYMHNMDTCEDLFFNKMQSCKC